MATTNAIEKIARSKNLTPEQLICEVLTKTEGNITDGATALGVSYWTLYRAITQYKHKIRVKWEVIR